ncbi:MAG: CDP-glucose 4,6-dehydratase [Aureliella sp.]
MIEEIQSAFRNKTVFITGHTGFKGSWLCLWLKQLGAQVVGYSLDPPTAPNNFTVSDISSTLKRHIFADVRDSTQMQSAILETQPDYVLHMAAQTVVKAGYDRPKETFDVNVMGTASVLDAVAALDKPCSVVCITSDKCYANDEGDGKRAFVESDPMGEFEPYGASKGCVELLVKAYTHSFFHPDQIHQHGKSVATARAGNVVGGGDWTPHALIPDLVRAAQSHTALELRNPDAIRPWQHVLQALSGYLLLAAKNSDQPGKYNGGWNFGPEQDNSLQVSELSDEFFDAWGNGSWKECASLERFHEARALSLSIGKASRQLDWTPTWDTRTTIRNTAGWYRSYFEGIEPRLICEQQIAEFEQAGIELQRFEISSLRAPPAAAPGQSA